MGQALRADQVKANARIPEELEGYPERAGLVLTCRSEKPLPGDFLTTGMRVHSSYWNKKERTDEPDQDGMPNYPDGDWLWVIAHFWPSGAVDLYPALGGSREPSVEQCIRITGDNWQVGHRLEPYGPFPVDAPLPRLG
jgi:hypothetical protein